MLIDLVSGFISETLYLTTAVKEKLLGMATANGNNNVSQAEVAACLSTLGARGAAPTSGTMTMSPGPRRETAVFRQALLDAKLSGEQARLVAQEWHLADPESTGKMPLSNMDAFIWNAGARLGRSFHVTAAQRAMWQATAAEHGGFLPLTDVLMAVSRRLRRRGGGDEDDSVVAGADQIDARLGLLERNPSWSVR